MYNIVILSLTISKHHSFISYITQDVIFENFIHADGCSCIVVNGDVVAQGFQFSLKDVDLVVAQVDLDKVCKLILSPSIYSLLESWRNVFVSVIVFLTYK